ncbi:MAG: DUF3307 domain-containing protein [Pseudomonadota bacterium]
MLALTAPMAQTFAALLLAHVIADFLLQPDWMVRRKREPAVLLAHIGVVGGLSLACLGGAWPVALGVAAAHLVIDAVKVWALPPRLRDTAGAFCTDQIAHLATLIVAALWVPGAAQSGLWAPWLDLLTIPAIALSGLILTVTAGGFAVGLLIAPYAAQVAAEGLPRAGKVIGQLERALIFLLVMIGQPAGIGFLIAAKSFLRFEASKEQKASEYVIIGTLASFGWALAIASLTAALMDLVQTLPDAPPGPE